MKSPASLAEGGLGTGHANAGKARFFLTKQLLAKTPLTKRLTESEKSNGIFADALQP
jgi:hypothetical protein